MKNRTKAILVVIAAAVAILGLFKYFKYRSSLSKPEVLVSGNIEATEMRLSFQVSGRIDEILADEGRFVKKGDVLARLDKEELTRSKELAEANLKEAEHNYKWLKEDYNRIEGLFEKGAATAQQSDAAKNKYDVSKEQVKAKKASLELAKIRLGYTDLSAPVDGFVLVKSAELGEVMQPGSTVFTVANLTDIWLTAYIDERDLGKVKLNQDVDVKTDTYPKKIYRGRVSFISEEAEFTPKQIQTTEERVKLVYRIKVVIDNLNLELKPGMPADGYIRIE